MHNNSSIFSSNQPASNLALKAAGLTAGIVVQLISLIFLVPDGNDYALATRDKHTRLEINVPRKVVFLGGSNLAYGIDSGRIEHDLGVPVVNMGMNGYLGVRFMLEEAKRDLNPLDVAVISFEYDNFYKSANGTGSDLLMIIKARPSSLRFVTHWQQFTEIASAVPFAAQQKTIRLLSNAGRGAKRWALALAGVRTEEHVSPEMETINRIESHAGFELHGDLVSHLSVAWPYEKEQGLNLKAIEVDPGVLDVLKQFSREMTQRGVRVLILPTPVLEDYYRTHEHSLARLHAVLGEAGLNILAPHTEFVYPDGLFFDTVYHLNKEGREIRTGKVIQELRPYLVAGGVHK